MNTRIPMAECRRQLALLWFSGGGMIFALMFIQTLLGHYRDHEGEAWGWLLPSIMPTLSLIVGVVVSDNERRGGGQATANRFLFRLAFTLSSFYLLVLLMTLLLDPLSRLPLTVVFRLSDVWLGPLQGLVAAVLAAFFVNR